MIEVTPEDGSGPGDLASDVVHEHRRLLRLLDDVDQPLPDPISTGLLATVGDAVHRHIDDEERVLHPLLRRRVPDGQRRVDAAVEEHEQIERLLAELDAIGPADPDVLRLLHGLACVTRRHIDNMQSRLLVAFLRPGSDAPRVAAGAESPGRAGTSVHT